MSDSPGRDSLPSLRLLPAMTFEPPVFCTGQFSTLLEIMVRSAIQHVVGGDKHDDSYHPCIVTV